MSPGRPEARHLDAALDHTCRDVVAMSARPSEALLASPTGHPLLLTGAVSRCRHKAPPGAARSLRCLKWVARAAQSHTGATRALLKLSAAIDCCNKCFGVESEAGRHSAERATMVDLQRKTPRARSKARSTDRPPSRRRPMMGSKGQATSSRTRRTTHNDGKWVRRRRSSLLCSLVPGRLFSLRGREAGRTSALSFLGEGP